MIYLHTYFFENSYFSIFRKITLLPFFYPFFRQMFPLQCKFFFVLNKFLIYQQHLYYFYFKLYLLNNFSSLTHIHLSQAQSINNKKQYYVNKLFL